MPDPSIRIEPATRSLPLVLMSIYGILRPTAAARAFSAARPAAVLATHLAYAVLLGLGVAILTLWETTYWYVPSTNSGLPASGAPVAANAVLSPRLCSFADAWDWYHAAGSIGDLEVTFFALVLVVPAATLALAVLNLPRVHRAGSIATALWWAYRAIASTIGFSLAIATTAGILFVMGAAIDLGALGLPPDFEDAAGVIVVLASIAGTLAWIGRTVAAVPMADPEQAGELHCERCGYNLAELPGHALCPECATRVSTSLSPARRPGIPWEKASTINAVRWLATAAAVLFTPARFYRKLRLRTPPQRAGRFATLVYASLGVLAGIWVMLMMVSMLYQPPILTVAWYELVGAGLMASLMCAVVCWFGHRLGGAIVIGTWIVWRSLPDTRWAAKVLGYESVFLCVYCAFWGTLATSFMFYDDWISKFMLLIGARYLFGMPDEFAVILGGTGLLSLLWLRRYLIALRCIRWSNY